MIDRTLTTLLETAMPGDLDVVVVCNGCSDDTATVAGRHPGVRVLEIPTPSKALAVQVGNDATDVFPRIHLDADVELSTKHALALIRALEAPGVLAVAPERRIEASRSALAVRWYYDVWNELPQVREGLFGRGVFAVTREGQARLDALPRLMSDDLAASEAFVGRERVVVRSANVVVQAPRTTRDLVKRRARVATGNAQADDIALRKGGSQTRLRTLITLARSKPSLAPRVPVFLAITLAARLRARRAIRRSDFQTWERDESSRL